MSAIMTRGCRKVICVRGAYCGVVQMAMPPSCALASEKKKLNLSWPWRRVDWSAAMVMCEPRRVALRFSMLGFEQMESTFHDATVSLLVLSVAFLWRFGILGSFILVFDI